MAPGGAIMAFGATVIGPTVPSRRPTVSSTTPDGTFNDLGGMPALSREVTTIDALLALPEDGLRDLRFLSEALTWTIPGAGAPLTTDLPRLFATIP